MRSGARALPRHAAVGRRRVVACWLVGATRGASRAAPSGGCWTYVAERRPGPRRAARPPTSPPASSLDASSDGQILLAPPGRPPWAAPARSSIGHRQRPGDLRADDVDRHRVVRRSRSTARRWPSRSTADVQGRGRRAGARRRRRGDLPVAAAGAHKVRARRRLLRRPRRVAPRSPATARRRASPAAPTPPPSRSRPTSPRRTRRRRLVPAAVTRSPARRSPTRPAPATRRRRRSPGWPRRPRPRSQLCDARHLR